MTKTALRSTILLPVFLPAVVIILLLVIGTISNPELAGQVFSVTLKWITETFGWFYMLSVAIFLVFIVCVAASSWGNIKLGPDHAQPQYSFAEWFSHMGNLWDCRFSPCVFCISSWPPTVDSLSVVSTYW